MGHEHRAVLPVLAQAGAVTRSLTEPTRSGWVGAGQSVATVRPPAGMRPSFTAADGRRVWALQPDVFLVQRDVGPDVDGPMCIPVVFDGNGITPRRWVPPAPVGRPRDTPMGVPGRVMHARSLIAGLAMALPIWAITLWSLRRLLGDG